MPSKQKRGRENRAKYSERLFAEFRAKAKKEREIRELREGLAAVARGELKESPSRSIVREMTNGPLLVPYPPRRCSDK